MGGLLSVSNGRRFRGLLASLPYVYAPGVGDALEAGLVAKVGFPAVYASGYSIANRHGFPDAGLMTQTEMVNAVRRIVALIESGIEEIPHIPVIADADEGYGGVGNVIRTVTEYARTGVAALHIEDQKFPKRCGHVAGKEVLTLEEAVGKFRAAVHARDRMDPDLYLIARTDAAGAVGGSLDEAIRRGRAYADTGVDAVWAELGNTKREPLARFAQEMKKTHPDTYLAVNYSSNLRWSKSKITHKELAEMGYRFIFTTLAAKEAATLGVYDHLVDILKNGAEAQWRLEERKEKHPVGSSQQLLGMLPWHLALEEIYFPGAVAKRDGSEGFGSRNDHHARETHGSLKPK